MIQQLYTTAVGTDLKDIRKQLAPGSRMESTFFANGRAGAIIAVPEDASVAHLATDNGEGEVYFNASAALRALTVRLGWARP